MLRQLDPDSKNLQDTYPPDWLPSIKTIKYLHREIEMAKDRLGIKGILDEHHQFPEEFKSRFSAAGINHEDYKTYMWASEHRLKQFGIHTGQYSWNWQWIRFMDKYPEATKDMMHEQLYYMLMGME